MTEKPPIEQNTGEDSGAAPQPSAPAAETSRPTLADWQAAAAKEVKSKD
jgi:methylmalonyl-CoA mutase